MRVQQVNWRIRPTGAAWLLAGGLTIGCSRGRSIDADLDAYRARRGNLARIDSSAPSPRGRYLSERIRLESTTGLAIDGIVIRPSAPGCFAAVLLQDGREENSGVIGRLPLEYGNVVVLSVDYPAELPYAVELSDFLFHSRTLRDAARTIPSAFSLGAAYLAQRGDVDSTRVAIAATSFAVPFAVIAAAADDRFRNVALIYGAGDLSSVLAANLPSVPRPLRRAVASGAMHSFEDFSPERFVGRIAPRPVLMVNGMDDPQMPETAVRHLYEAAQEPKTMIWLRTGHLMPTDSALIGSLIDTAFARLPVLRDTSWMPNCAPPAHR